MNRRIFISVIVMVVALVAAATDVSAQEYNRERLRGNVRTINQGADEISITVGVDNKDFEAAIRVLYDGFAG